MKKKKKNKNKKESFMSKLFVDDETFDDEEELEQEENNDDISNQSTLENIPVDSDSKTIEEPLNQSNEETFDLDVMDIKSKAKSKVDFEETAEFDGFESSLYPSKKPYNGTTIGLIIAIIVLVIGIAVAIVFYKGSATKQVEVLNLVGKTDIEVKKWCKENKLDETRCLFETEFSETIPENQVISQSISSGEKLNAKTTITFKISEGKDPDYLLEIPDLSKMNSDEIMAFFSDNEFENVTFEYEVNPDKPDDSFISSNIKNNKAKRSDAIVILISIQQASDDMEIEVPDFSEYTKANMQAWANKYRINLVFIEDYSDKVEKGQFISQSIKAGEKIKVKDKISITLSKGKKITMEDFTNKSSKEVQAWCDANKIKCTFTDTTYSTVAKGNIAAQNVKKGTMVGNIKSIKFTVSLGDTVEIGSYKDQDFKKLEERVSTLNKLGANLKIKKETEITNTKENDNKVVSNTESIKINSEVLAKVYTYQASQVEVPKCSGSEEEYKKSLTGINLKPQRQGEKYSSNAVGSVLGCSLSSGKVNEGTTISYFISKGEYKPNASDFNGKTDSDARNMINTAVNQGASNWRYSSTSEYNSEVASGITFGCSISSTTLTCKVSKGSQPTVGNYVGKTWGGTDKWDVNGNGTVILTITDRVYSDSVEINKIISQDVAEGTKIENSIRVGVVISKGPKPIELPEPPHIEVGKPLNCTLDGDSCKIDTYTITVTRQEHEFEENAVVSASCDKPSQSCQVVLSSGLKKESFTVVQSWFNEPFNNLESAKQKFRESYPFNLNFDTVANDGSNNLYQVRIDDKVYDGTNCNDVGGTKGQAGCTFTVTSKNNVTCVINVPN